MKYELTDIYKAIDGQLAIYTDQLKYCRENGYPEKHIEYLRGCLEGMKAVKTVIPVCHLLPTGKKGGADEKI